MTIKTDHKWKSFVPGMNLPKRCRRDFDYIQDESEYETHEFIRYRGRYYDPAEFLRTGENNSLALLGWDGYLTDTYFSGVLLALSPDGDQYKIGSYYVS